MTSLLIRSLDRNPARPISAPTPADRLAYLADYLLALSAIATEQASIRPEINGAGLTRIETTFVNAHRTRTERRAARFIDATAADTFHEDCGRVAAQIALRIVLGRRPLPTVPSDPWDVEADPSDWPDDTDAFTWEMDDEPYEPEPEDWAFIRFPATPRVSHWETNLNSQLNRLGIIDRATAERIASGRCNGHDS